MYIAPVILVFVLNGGRLRTHSGFIMVDLNILKTTECTSINAGVISHVFFFANLLDHVQCPCDKPRPIELISTVLPIDNITISNEM